MIPQNITATIDLLNDTAALGALADSGIASGSSSANLTVFIPNNAAFQAIGSVFANVSATELPGLLAGILSYHIVPDVVDYSTDLVNGTKLLTATHGNLTIRRDGNDVFVNSAKVVVPDVLVKEGVVHIIDK